MALSESLNHFNDLIVEHTKGSVAGTLRSNFTTLRDQIEALETSHAALKKAHAVVKKDYAALKDEITHLQKENTDLEVQLAYFNGSKFELSPEALQILQYLFNEDQFYSAKDFAAIFEWELGVAKHHCEKLKDLKLVAVRRRAITSRYEASEDIGGNAAGRAYLVDNNLVWKDPRDSE